MTEYPHALTGCLLGTAVGDALGLPCEGLSRKRLVKLFPQRDRYAFWGHSGFVSDDTEHAIMVIQSLIVSVGQPDLFAKELARRLRWWLLRMPAGIGLATLRSICKLWLGFSPARSGVFSAGNGPAMRSPILGVAFGHDPELLKILVKASTEMTHRDPKAYHGALAVALAAHLAAQGTDCSAVRESLQIHLGETDLWPLLEQVFESVEKKQTTLDFAVQMGCQKGVTGYIYHTVPVAFHAWLAHPGDVAGVLQAAIACGGDTDTVAAIAGAIVAAGTGPEGIPALWLSELKEWPASVAWMRQLTQQLAEVLPQRQSQVPLQVAWPLVLLRNLWFTAVVLAHGFRRLAPPY